ncbi:Immunity protein Imm1 [Actinopolyspora mzabensis]|uniref:Immunity protein Imm1 n=1 Tax=Actinopolyspora mzabensis TaxID=995066 RepID=A0A1G9DP77_ACTMZ|nr:Imm1 family immunity protein [Actinopolyspora mzabensis]SDK65630.1 Immunity protein Imm1 [Actinopolyspora mzabensis]
MTTIDTGTVVTGILGHDLHYARTPEETADLVEAVLRTRYSQIYVWDRPCLSFRDEHGPAFPHARLRITADPDNGWGALSHMDARPEAVNGAAADSYNPHTTEETPPLLFDPEGDLWFPASASLPLDQAREAITEYCRTGTRPESVRWQPGQWY